jgi:precorrin-3B synthase
MIRGWCPDLHRPMPAKDGLLLRVAPPGGVLTAEAARLLADVAEQHGSGIIELTQRARLQLRTMDAQRAIPALVAAGLGEADPQRERRRLVIGSPLLGDDPAIAGGTGGLMARLEARLMRDPATDRLGDKFLFVVDGGGVLRLDDVRADVLLRVGDGVVTLRGADGQSLVCPPGRAIAAALRLAQKARARPPAPSRRPAPAGFIAYPGTRRGAFAATPVLGRLDAALLRHLAGLAESHGTGTLRTTPWGCLLLPGTTAPDTLTEAARALGLITEADDPRRRVVACTGQPGCASATVDARADALRIAPSVPRGALWHISGCAKRCAHPGPAAASLIGEDGLYLPLRGAQPAGAKLPLDQALAALLA